MEGGDRDREAYRRERENILFKSLLTALVVRNGIVSAGAVDKAAEAGVGAGEMQFKSGFGRGKPI